MYRLRRSVYLDNNATTQLSRTVLARMNRVMRDVYANPSSPHGAARRASAIIEDARADVAAAIGCGASEICFTGSATEANNAVLKGLADLRSSLGRNTIVTTPIEHPSVLATLDYLRDKGFDIALAPVIRSGRVDLERLEQAVGPDTLLVCCALANNEIGTIQDVAAVAAIAHRAGALVLSDAVQALGKLPVDVRALGVDYATFSAHKLHGPKGVGALYIRAGAPFSPLLHGGHQEARLRAGTESVHNIAGFGAACRDVPRLLERAARVREQRDRLVAGLRELVPDLVANHPADGALGNTASLRFPGTDNGLLIADLDFHGIAVSAGSACHSRTNEPSHVLAAIGASDVDARQTIRVSLGMDTTERDIDYVLAVFRDRVANGSPAIGMVRPGQLDENLLSRPETFVLDIRFPYDRALLRSLPRAHEASFLSFAKVAGLVPRDRDVIIVCQAGLNAGFVARHLQRLGHRRLSILLTGMAGWRIAQPALYERLAGKDVVPLSAAS